MSKSWIRHQDPENPWLNHDDIVGNSPCEVEITGHESKESFNPGTNKKDDLWGITMKGSGLILGLCKTNAYLIRTITGEVDPDKWAGHKVTLRTATCKGDECIRIGVEKGTKVPKKYPKFEYTDKEK